MPRLTSVNLTPSGPKYRLRAGVIDKDTSRTWIQHGDTASTIITETRRMVAVQLSRQLASSSPLYSRIVGATLDVLIPPGTQLQLPPDAAQGYKDTAKWFWETGPSAILPSARSLIKTLVIDGELVLRPRVNTADGRVTLSLIGVDTIDELQIGAEGFMPIAGIKFLEDDHPYKVISNDATGKKLDGELFYFRMFPTGYTTTFRGAPLLIADLDEIAALTEFIYKRISRLNLITSNHWDVTLQGATQDAIDEFLESQHAIPPEAAEIKAHNEAISWDSKTLQDRRGSDVSKETRTYIDFLVGACGLTPEFLGYTQGRDITTESLFAAITHLDALREDVFNILSLMIRFQLEQARERDGSLAGTDVPSFKIIAKQIGTRSLQRAAQAFVRYADGLTKAVKEQLIDREQAASVLKLLLVQLGLTGEEVGLPEELKKPSEQPREPPEEPPQEPRESTEAHAQIL